MKAMQKLTWCLGLILLLASLSSSQQKVRTLDQGPSYPNQPIEVVSRELGDKPFIDDTRVLGDQDWLKRIRLGIKNVSNKNILSFDIDLRIEKEGKTLTSFALPILFRTYNKPTANNALTPQGEKKLGLLRPGEVVKVNVSDQHLAAFSDLLKEYEAEDIERVRIDIRFVYFKDETRWAFGQESRPDPTDPGKRISSDQPAPDLGQRFSEWMNYLLPVAANRSGCRPLALILPTGSQFFFTYAVARPAAAPPPSCVWFVESELDKINCSGSNSHSCTGDDNFCRFEDFAGAIHTSNPGGTAVLGYMSLEPYTCKTNSTLEDPPSCSTCMPFQHNVFRADPQCGQPGNCAQPATWGCAAGLVDIGGVCQKSLAFQSTCAPPAGYDPLSCSCPSGFCGTNEYVDSHSCNDGLDNDCDGLTDCDDPDCALSVACHIYDPDSPIVVDVAGNGFNLTNYAGGVMFDLDRNGTPEQLSWTSAYSDDAWLVLDRNDNGTIDSGKELFGNFTPQPTPPDGEERNGFLALAVFDRPGKGGNNDGFITKKDDVFSRLRLWQDINHNGISESAELHPLPELGLRKIELQYQRSGRVDQFGNRFKYRARVRDAQDAQLGRWAWDVFLITSP
ncbi:MAG TPA: hypothetical protein VGO50_06550 [Pyrinomonadaceae bacterium]|jgi:hypothetical protein|nr:hypothetical protein [Pyrinomonadaceae bacterium]